MFLKFRVKAAIAKFIYMNKGHSDTLKFFESGPIDNLMPLIENQRFDPNQGAVAVVTATITQGAKTGGLNELKSLCPHIYRDLVSLWNLCGTLLAQDEQRWGNAVIVGEIDCNPFDYAERHDS